MDSGWQTLHASPHFTLDRRGRFLVARLAGPHATLSTSARAGGQTEDVAWLVNHQSCEGNGHQERHDLITNLGLDGYHDSVCLEIGIDPARTAVMGTAANMNYAGVVTCEDAGMSVTAAVTAGVHTNAACAGDPAAWRESGGKWERVNPLAGTINTMLLISRPLTEGALARAAVTMTEAKSAALTRLAIGSRYSRDPATGTGTDQFAIACPRDGSPPMTSPSPHTKLGELIGVAVRDATLEALRWQNGLESSLTRSVFHALGRYGLAEASFLQDIAPLLSERSLQLLRSNVKAPVHEPLVGAAAYAIAAVLDRVRYGTLPAGLAREALRQQGASLAASVAAKPECWSEFYRALPEPDAERPAPFVLAAIALGWASKWT
jgi:adenosylcobinamide amidohydrolase